MFIKLLLSLAEVIKNTVTTQVYGGTNEYSAD